MEEAVQEAVLPPKDLSLIVKGKRTKRMRPVSSSLNCISDVNNISPPPSSSEEEGVGGMANNNIVLEDEDDEELAINCLILLSQGTPNYKNNNDHQGVEKFTSKKYIEAPISSNGKAGMYVYQCKTCGRTFPSFQALGGHRASHKKPRNIAAAAAAAAVEANNNKVGFFLSDDEDDHEAFRIKNYYYKSKKPTAGLSLELNNWGGDIVSSPLPKIHECSYCGAQFASGQALGGHMRRHRGTVMVTPRTTLTPSTNTTTLSLSPFPISPASINQEYCCDQDDILIDQMKKRKNALTLDLNLPAPDDHNAAATAAALASKNHQQKQQQQQQQTESAGLVISTGRFIECRY